MNKSPSSQELEKLTFEKLQELAGELAEEDDNHIKRVRHYFIEEFWKRIKQRRPKAGDIAEGQLVSIKVGEEQILLAKAEGKIYAMGNRCPHRNFPLHRGHLKGFTLTCPNHGAEFDIRTGACTKHSTEVYSCETFETELHQDGTVECRAKKA